MESSSENRKLTAAEKAVAAEKAQAAEKCIQGGIEAGFKSACVTCVATTIPTLLAVRTIPWAKANLNYTGQALIISGATMAAFLIKSEHTIMQEKKSRRKN